VLSDLAALTPPLLVCAVFVIGVTAFLRHEMRRAKNSPGDESVEVSTKVSAQPRDNPADSHATTHSPSEGTVDPGSD
jgi:hypothetical protein